MKIAIAGARRKGERNRMKDAITLKVTKGRRKGTLFVFDRRESVLIGRRRDCAILLPDDHVSRHHCEIEIDPPFARARDLGSLNGTWLNGALIGRRTKGAGGKQTVFPEQAFADMKDGDILGIGQDCELELSSTASDDAELSYLTGYVPIELIGRGDLGRVWRARKETGDEEYAVKVLNLRGLSDERDKVRFMREMDIGNRLDHANIVRRIESGAITDDRYYIVCEFCGGGNVNDLMKRTGGALSMDTATHIILQALDALAYLHHVHFLREDGKTTHGFVHRDISPNNILLADASAKPLAKISDFGLSKLYELTDSSNANAIIDSTATGEFAGKPEFTPRIQIKDYKRAKPEADVWAAAATYYYMLTGLPPKRLERGERWKLALIEDAVPIRERNPGIPAKLAAVIDRALTERPQIGCRDANELRMQIEAALQ
jgi:serine/threonine protein kinase